jgi:hypothetical protein
VLDITKRSINKKKSVSGELCFADVRLISFISLDKHGLTVLGECIG